MVRKTLIRTALSLVLALAIVKPVTSTGLTMFPFSLDPQPALTFLGLFLCVPLVAIFAQALQKGVTAYLAALREPDSLAALRLTLLTAATPCR